MLAFHLSLLLMNKTALVIMLMIFVDPFGRKSSPCCDGNLRNLCPEVYAVIPSRKCAVFKDSRFYSLLTRDYSEGRGSVHLFVGKEGVPG